MWPPVGAPCGCGKWVWLLASTMWSPVGINSPLYVCMYVGVCMSVGMVCLLCGRWWVSPYELGVVVVMYEVM